MSTRHLFSYIYIVFIVVLSVCTVTALRSKRKFGKSVGWLEAALILPLLGSFIIISAPTKEPALVGSYIYFVGMDFVMLALVKFAAEYCKGTNNNQKIPNVVYIILGIDAVQILLNPFLGFTFNLKEIEIDGQPYYQLVPLIGQTFHRIVDYAIFTCILLIFLMVTVRMPKIYREKYSVILLSMVMAGIWQAFYSISRTPIDTSVIGFGISGILIFYFALYYHSMRLLDRMLSNIVSDLADAMFVFDPTGNCIWANEQGRTLVKINGNNYDDVVSTLKDIFGDFTNFEKNTLKHTVGSGDDMRSYILEENHVKDEEGKLNGLYLRIKDITEQEQQFKKESYETRHDTLTGLYTKEYLYQKIRETLEEKLLSDCLMIFVNIKDFKVVNDIFGYNFGNYALQRIAEWIRTNANERCIYGRLGGDNFGICMPTEDFDSDYFNDELSQFIIESGAIKYHPLIHFGAYRISAEINEENTDISVLFDRAHLALATIPDGYQVHIAYYDDKIREKILWNQKISAQLTEAIAQRQIRPYLQPIADPTGKIVGAEALARWIHPEQGFMSPGIFIPIFEENGMIVDVDKYMWKCACEILARWKTKYPDLFISVNISPKDFYFTDVIHDIKSLTERYDVNPVKLRIEITETVMMTNSDDKMQILEKFRENGFVVEMDDFGSGYSSLNMLKDMPVDVLKIDMRFLSKSKDEKKAQTIVKNIIRLSEELGIDSLTEGVETEKQYHILSDMGCKLFQGYYFAKPLPLEEFEKKLDTELKGV